MIDYSDKKWEQLTGGYQIPYNPIPILQKLESNIETEECWKELWNELHHQGDVGDASYASLVKLVEIQEKNTSFDWNFYALVGVIEMERLRKKNPNVPEWLKLDYKNALIKLNQLASRDLNLTEDPLMVRAVLGVLALLKKQYDFGMMILYTDISEIKSFVEEHFYLNEFYDIGKKI